MSDCLSKPFTSQELWRVLLKHLTPVSDASMDEHEPEREENERQKLQRKLRANFFKNNQTVYAEITEAIAAGDLKLAHRRAHSLKGNAGQIGKTGLQNAAADVEALLKDGTTPISEESMSLLKSELMLVIEELRPPRDQLASREAPPPMSAEQALALFEELEPMLENINPECMNMLDDIRAIPGAEELARHIEDYNFESAARTLVELKKKRE
jgi:HPt (histidine-containing phosphotransfer) domain-containing protein